MDTREERIRERAYLLWEADDRRDGNQMKHWEQAEREIDSEGEAAQSLNSARSGPAQGGLAQGGLAQGGPARPGNDGDVPAVRRKPATAATRKARTPEESAAKPPSGRKPAAGSDSPPKPSPSTAKPDGSSGPDASGTRRRAAAPAQVQK